MIASYWLRLLLVCFASFFLIHGAMAVAVSASQRRALQLAEQLAPGRAARLLLWLRMLPAGVATALVAAVCAPSYVRFEPDVGVERVGLVCLGLAFLGVLLWIIALARGLRSAVRSIRFARACRRSGRVVRLSPEVSELLVVGARRPFLVQCGILRPDFVISERLLTNFSGAELAAALAHERAHWLARDNLKRLALRFVPAIVPLSLRLEAIERGWAKFAERAADDVVSAQGPAAALGLASALVRLARMCSAIEESAPAPDVASSLRGSDDLSVRVERLLAPAPLAAKAGVPVWALCGAGGLLMAGCFTVLLSPTLLMGVHELVERLLH
ncbi:MAG TPA: M48 family metalloprotease [Candidatus Cybelea sp.]|nr:M48 family metalloprotease [Candidatus Cybelea sp.]